METTHTPTLNSRERRAPRVNQLHIEKLQALASQLNAHAEEVCRFLLPNGVREGKEWRIGSPKGEVGHSMAICVAGAKTGQWADFADEEAHKGPHLISLWQQVRGVDERKAMREAERWLANRPAKLPAGSVGTESKPLEVAAVPPPISSTTEVDWKACEEAVTPELRAKLAEWRGLSLDFCDWAWRFHYLGIHEGGWAFPMHKDGAVVGLHVCWGSRKWQIIGGAARPLILSAASCRHLSTVTRIHICEGQWDAFAIADRLGFHRKKSEAFLITRGANNGRLVAGMIPPGKTVLVWMQNDELKNGRRAAEVWLSAVVEHAGTTVRVVSTPSKFKDPNDWTRAGATPAQLRAAINAAKPVSAATPAAPVPAIGDPTPARPPIEFFSPLQIKEYQPVPDTVLIGDCHIVRGSTFVIGGQAGVGKSRAVTALAIAGATGKDWFGLRVHARFRTMIIQNENGRFRLMREFSELQCDQLEPWIRICAPPPLGLRFDDGSFTSALALAIREFKPAIVVIDPWNAAAPDDKARDYLETFEDIRRVIPPGNDSPALGIVAHTRKPKGEERISGRGLLNLLAGSYVLGSVPRSVFVMQPASDDPEDDRVVWTCCKNNDGDMGPRSAWERRNGLFAPVLDFDWDAFAEPGSSSRTAVSEADLLAIFELGSKKLKRAEAVKLLMAKTGSHRAACYAALKADGRFAHCMHESDGLLEWTKAGRPCASAGKTL